MKNHHLFIDESGDPSLKSINHDFPIFALLGILISDKEYEKLNDEFNKIKTKYFGSTNVIFHSRDIRKCEGVFAKLFDLKTKESFYRALNETIEKIDYKIITSVIKKEDHIKKYGKLADDPYEIGLTFLLERVLFELDEFDGFAEVMIESRGKNEDSNLAAKYNELITRGSHKVKASRFMSRYSGKAIFHPKSKNDNGLQMADLCAYPTARHILHPDQPYPAYDKISNKFRKSNKNRVEGYGIKVFP